MLAIYEESQEAVETGESNIKPPESGTDQNKNQIAPDKELALLATST